MRLGSSLDFVAASAGISGAELSRVERAKAEWVSLVTLARLCAVVGLDLTVKAYPGGPPIRDARHGRMLARFKVMVHPSSGWRTEVPLPNSGDQRAWDAMVRGTGWRYGVEAEMNPIDGQALMRRLNLKQRDGMVDGVILLLPETRQSRAFRHEFAAELERAFPIGSAAALKRLSSGLEPGGSAVIVI